MCGLLESRVKEGYWNLAQQSHINTSHKRTCGWPSENPSQDWTQQKAAIKIMPV